MPMRCRWPPENSCGKRFACSGLRPTVRRSSSTRSLPSRPPVDAVDPQRLGDDVAHRHARVQRRVRVLEDDLHARGASAASDAACSVGDVAALEDDLPGRRLDELHHRAPERRLAAAGLAHDAERLAAPHGRGRRRRRRARRRPVRRSSPPPIGKCLTSPSTAQRAAVVHRRVRRRPSIPAAVSVMPAAPRRCRRPAPRRAPRRSGTQSGGRPRRTHAAAGSPRGRSPSMGVQAARMERATRRRRDHARRLARDRRSASLADVHVEQGCSSGRSCTGGAGELKIVNDVRELDDAARVHHDAPGRRARRSARGRG